MTQIVGVRFEVALLAIVRQPDVFKAPVVQFTCILRLSLNILCVHRLRVHRLVQEARQVIFLVKVLLGHLCHLLFVDNSLLLHLELDYAILLVLGRLGQLSVRGLRLLQLRDHRQELLANVGFRSLLFFKFGPDLAQILDFFIFVLNFTLVVFELEA